MLFLQARAFCSNLSITFTKGSVPLTLRMFPQVRQDRGQWVRSRPSQVIFQHHHSLVRPPRGRGPTTTSAALVSGPECWGTLRPTQRSASLCWQDFNFKPFHFRCSSTVLFFSKDLSIYFPNNNFWFFFSLNSSLYQEGKRQDKKTRKAKALKTDPGGYTGVTETQCSSNTLWKEHTIYHLKKGKDLFHIGPISYRTYVNRQGLKSQRV